MVITSTRRKDARERIKQVWFGMNKVRRSFDDLNMARDCYPLLRGIFSVLNCEVSHNQQMRGNWSFTNDLDTTFTGYFYIQTRSLSFGNHSYCKRSLKQEHFSIAFNMKYFYKWFFIHKSDRQPLFQRNRPKLKQFPSL